MVFRLTRKLLAVAIVVVLALLSVNISSAQESSVGGEEGGSGVQIIPTRTDMSLLPGEQKEFSVTVKNVTQGPIDVKTFFNDFEADGVTGEPQIVVDPNREVPTSMKDFVKGLEDFSLGRDEQKEVTLTIDVPASASPGGYFGAVRFAAVPQGSEQEDTETQVSLTASVASLVFVEVSGEIKEQIQIDGINVCAVDEQQTESDLDTANTSNAPSVRCETSSGLFFTQPNRASIRIINKGNGFARPFGRVTLTRGGEEVYAYELNNTEPRGTVLPQSSRIFSDDINDVNSFGKYTLTANISYGQGGEVITQTTTFWYIPTIVLAIAGLALVALLAIVFVIYKKLGKKRRR